MSSLLLLSNCRNLTVIKTLGTPLELPRVANNFLFLIYHVLLNWGDKKYVEDYEITAEEFCCDLFWNE